MNSYDELIKEKNLNQLFVFGMYRSGTTVVARSLAGESRIAFASDPIRPFFNFYRTKLQFYNKLSLQENSSRPLGDYFNDKKDYVNHLIKSNFSEKISITDLHLIRDKVIKQASVYSPKLIDNLINLKKNISFNYSNELQNYLSSILRSYGNSDTCLIGLKEVWTIEMSFPILNMIGSKAKILVVLRDPLDIVASSIKGSANYSILSLSRQWRKQIVFYNLLKFMFPNQVEVINYEDFCLNPRLNLKNKIEKLTNHKSIFFSEKLVPTDDDGNVWIKNSSYFDQESSEKIDTKSIGKNLNILDNSEIEWMIYLTHMLSYKRYNRKSDIPKKPVSSFPKRNMSNVAAWAKADLVKLESNNLDKELKYEHDRIDKMMSISNFKFDTNYVMSQI